jgi:hypothetical protein
MLLLKAGDRIDAGMWSVSSPHGRCDDLCLIILGSFELAA